MTKTKIRVSPSLLAYRQEMTQLVNDLRDEKLRIAARAEQDLEPFEYQMGIPGSDKVGLLTPPWIETLLPEFYLRDGSEIEGIIHIVSSDLFGITSMTVTMRDEARNLLESGDAMLDENWLGLWTYLPRTAPLVGTAVIVRAVATDALCGMNIAEEKVTLTDEYLRSCSDLVEG